MINDEFESKKLCLVFITHTHIYYTYTEASHANRESCRILGANIDGRVIVLIQYIVKKTTPKNAAEV